MNEKYIKAIKELEPSARILNIKEITIVSLYWGAINGKKNTLAEIGKMFGVSRERIRQIIAKAMLKMNSVDKSLDTSL